jgi:hypothetical protein
VCAGRLGCVDMCVSGLGVADGYVSSVDGCGTACSSASSFIRLRPCTACSPPHNSSSFPSSAFFFPSAFARSFFHLSTSSFPLLTFFLLLCYVCVCSRARMCLARPRSRSARETEERERARGSRGRSLVTVCYLSQSNPASCLLSFSPPAFQCISVIRFLTRPQDSHSLAHSHSIMRVHTTCLTCMTAVPGHCRQPAVLPAAACSQSAAPASRPAEAAQPTLSPHRQGRPSVAGGDAPSVCPYSAARRGAPCGVGALSSGGGALSGGGGAPFSTPFCTSGGGALSGRAVSGGTRSGGAVSSCALSGGVGAASTRFGR